MRALNPEITKIEPITVLTVTSIGDPNKSEQYFEALYGTAYATKFKVYKPLGKEMKFGKLIGRWPDAHLKPKNQWTGIWGLPVPDFVQESDLLQKNPDIPVRVARWEYGEVAQVLHKGPYSEEGPTVDLLHKFIKDSCYEIDGNSHEEEYLTSPDAKDQKTIIRYKIKKKLEQRLDDV
jgi:hypothetical protein